jgi:glycosyltransferase involved in cell wall biosynthesis
MNVGLVVPGFSADETDWCIPALRHLASSLAADDRVRVIAVRYPYRPMRYQVDGATVIALGGGAVRGPAVAGLWRGALDTLRAEHRRRPFDVLHAFWATESGLLAALAGRLLRVPTLVSLAGGELVRLPEIGYGDQRSPWERVKIRVALRTAGAVAVGSRYLARIAARHVGPVGVRLAPLGVDTALFAPIPGDQSPGRKLVHVGTLTPVKDQRLLLHAFAAVRRRGPAATLDVVGGGPERPALERLAADLGVAASVCFRGEQDHATLPAVYRGGSAFVLTSRHEAQGMVALEAAACGVPVFGTRVGVLPDLALEPADVVDVGAAEALAESLANHLGTGPEAPNPALRARVEAEYSLPRAAARYRGLYRDLHASGPR